MSFEGFDDREKENHLDKFRTTAMQNKVSRKISNLEYCEDFSI